MLPPARSLGVAVLIAAGIALTFQGPVSSLSPAFGAFDTINGNESSTVDVPAGYANTIRVTGWAATADFPATPLGVRVRIGVNYTFPPSNFRIADGYRPDVGAAYPGYGNYHGFDFTVPVRSGTHVVCIEAQNSGVYNVIGNCKTVQVSGSTTEGRFIGGLFSDTPFVALNVQYTRGTTWATDIDTAANRWDPAANLEVAFTASNQEREIAVFAINFPPQINYLWGRARYSPWCTALTDDCGGGALPWVDRTYSANYVYLNTGSTDLDDPADGPLRRKVIAHEFGHAIGLAHPPNPGVNTVMAQGFLGGVTVEVPSAWDIESVDIAYK